MNWARLGLAVTASLVSLAVLELACQWLLPLKPPVRFAQNKNLLAQFGWQQSGSVIETDPELFWRLIPNTELPRDAWPLRGRVANAQGLRESEEVAARSTADEIRILFLGDSCTFGSGLLLEEGFVQRTEDLLALAFPDVPVESINAGVPGYSLFQGWHFLNTSGEPLGVRSP